MCSALHVTVSVIISAVFVTKCHGSPYSNSTLFRETRAVGRGCQLPQHPQNGRWTIYDSSDQLYPGNTAPSKTILQVTCRNKYTLDGDSTIFCKNGEWTAKIGQCLRTCPPLLSTPVMTVTCTHNNRKLEQCTNAVDQTKARFQCADFYEDQSLERHPVHVCYNGKWSHKMPECVPICGQKSSKNDPTLIVGGKNVTKGEYPWQVALYNSTDKNLLCGGSLLNPRVILTAAHCVTTEDGNLLPAELYTVAVGKYYRRYDAPDDFNDAQFSAVHKMFVPKQYKADIQNYFGDIAILVTKKTFQLSLRVQPVCVDWDFKHSQNLLDPSRNKWGYVSGWGFTAEYKNPSPILKELKVPLISDEECNKKLDEDYTKYLTYDKLCAGFLESGTAACKGDSGGGLVAQVGNRYYVMGVVSLSPQAQTQEGGCNSQQYTLFTRVSYYIENFILEKEAQFKPVVGEEIPCEEDPNCTDQPASVSPTPSTTESVVPNSSGKCKLPEHPLFGKWSIFGVSTLLSPGVLVSSGTILNISCNKGYLFNSKNIITCENGRWQPEIGQCLKTCPRVRSSQTTQFTCSFKEQEINCSTPYDGTIVKHTCSPFYEDIQLSKNPVRVCRNGSWDNALPECFPICGLKSVTPQTLIVNGETVERTQYPWHVAVYRQDPNLGYQFICNGALISEKLILTAAHCVSNHKGQLQPKGNYIVAVGKYYRDYNVRDPDQQFSKLQDIFVPLQFSGVTSNYLGDIAIIVATKPFKLSRSVQPVCIDYGSKNISPENGTNTVGFISGFGYTLPNGRPADKLQSLEVPIIPKNRCIEDLPEDFQPFYTYDKLCAGYLNQNVSACTGDTGSALVTKYDGRYYATGIVSTAPALPVGGCNSNQYTLYTKVSTYINFILEKEAQFKMRSPTDGDCDGDSCETTTRPPPVTPPTRASCILPQLPAFGKWEVFTTSRQYLPGDLVPTGTVLRVSCYSTYKLFGDSTILCENGKWSSKISSCSKTCPSAYSTPRLKVTCLSKDKESDNCTEPVDGTSIKYECAPFYEDKDLTKNPIHSCQNGEWSHPRPQCQFVCGQKSVTPQILIINGKSVNKGEYPWHVGIYKLPENKFLCSGSIISERLIITGAQCVAYYNATLRPIDSFRVAAGKYYTNDNDPREDTSEIQYAELEDIFIPPEFHGPKTLFVANIAILLTKKPFTFSLRVQPVCLDLELKYEIDFVKANRNLTGYVTGWGYTTETGKPADSLQELEIPIINDVKCQQELPEEFSNYLTHDKFCGGYRNKGKSVCRGDSGGGLVTKFDGKYYIVGIVDIAPVKSGGGCDSQQYTLYTKIYSYINSFIADKMKKYKV